MDHQQLHERGAVLGGGGSFEEEKSGQLSQVPVGDSPEHLPHTPHPVRDPQIDQIRLETSWRDGSSLTSFGPFSYSICGSICTFR